MIQKVEPSILDSNTPVKPTDRTHKRRVRALSSDRSCQRSLGFGDPSVVAALSQVFLCLIYPKHTVRKTRKTSGPRRKQQKKARPKKKWRNEMGARRLPFFSDVRLTRSLFDMPELACLLKFVSRIRCRTMTLCPREAGPRIAASKTT